MYSLDTIFSCWNNQGKNRQAHYRNKNRLLIIIRCSISTLHLKYISNVLSTKNRMSWVISECIKIEMSTKYIHFYWLKWFHVLNWHFWIHLVQTTSCAKARFTFFVYMTLKKLCAQIVGLSRVDLNIRKKTMNISIYSNIGKKIKTTLYKILLTI